MKLDLRRPCPKCPFRTDVPGYLRRGRASEIALSLANGDEFVCHATTVESEDGMEMEATPDSQFCAGALLVLEHEEAPNQVMRVAERLGLYEPTRMDRSAPVHTSLAAFVSHHDADDPGEEQDCCSVCDFGCEAPAGFLVNGVAVPAEPEGDLHVCEGCGEPVCDACSNADGICNRCSDYEEG